MRTPIIDGRSIDQFIPANLRDMFYRHPMPEYKYAVHDGYAPYSFTTDGLVLYLPLWALKGSPFKSVDAYKHTGTVFGALERPDGRLFDGNDYISIPHTASLNLTTGVTLETWVYPTTFAGDFRTIAGKGSGEAYYFRTRNTGATYFAIRQSTVEKSSPEVVLPLNTWSHVFGVYDGANVLLYVNTTQYVGVAATGAIDTNSVDFEIGRRATSNDDYWIGSIGEGWIYNQGLSALAVQHNDLATKWRY